MNKLIIDVREKSLKEYFISKSNVEIKQLDLGDIIFTRDDKTIIIIERKTIKDLRASIKDGRHREQKIRLLSNFKKHIIYYLIEGDILDFEIKYGDKDIKSLYGAMINSLVRDNLKIIRTIDINETIKYIETMFDKLNKQPSFFIQEESFNKDNNQDYCSAIKIKKKDNITCNVCFISQLCQIQGVSINIAKKILEHYSSMFCLCLSYKDLEENDAIKLLVDIEIDTNTGKKRKLGKVLSERIYRFLCNKETSNKIDNI